MHMLRSVIGEKIVKTLQLVCVKAMFDPVTNVICKAFWLIHKLNFKFIHLSFKFFCLEFFRFFITTCLAILIQIAYLVGLEIHFQNNHQMMRMIIDFLFFFCLIYCIFDILFEEKFSIQNFQVLFDFQVSSIEVLHCYEYFYRNMGHVRLFLLKRRVL